MVFVCMRLATMLPLIVQALVLASASEKPQTLDLEPIPNPKP